MKSFTWIYLPLTIVSLTHVIFCIDCVPDSEDKRFPTFRIEDCLLKLLKLLKLM